MREELKIEFQLVEFQLKDVRRVGLCRANVSPYKTGRSFLSEQYIKWNVQSYERGPRLIAEFAGKREVLTADQTTRVVREQMNRCCRTRALKRYLL